MLGSHRSGPSFRPTGAPSQCMWVAVQGVTQDSQMLGDHRKHTRSKLGRAEAARVSPALEIVGSSSLCTWASKLVKLKLLSLT